MFTPRFFRPVKLWTIGAVFLWIGSMPLIAQTAAKTRELTINLFGRTAHLRLSVGLLGLITIFVLILLLTLAVVFAVVARSRARQAVAANRKLEAEIAERTRIEGALRESHERTSAILETALDGIITMDQEGKIVEFNPSAEKIFGYR